MSDDGDPFVVLNWVSESSVFGYGEPDDFLYEADGSVLSVDDDDGRSLVGKFRIYYVDVDRAMSEHMSVFDVFDAHSHTVGYYDAIYGDNWPDFSDRSSRYLSMTFLVATCLFSIDWNYFLNIEGED
jgi:hypothetical protein